jgi:zinc/manganese transport system substrate-binding protein
VPKLLPAIATATIVTAAALSLAGCSSTAAGSATPSGKLSVVASTDVWGNVAKQVGGSHVSVRSIIDDPNKDPHEYQADAQNQLAISQAAVVIENGGGYDDFVTTMLSAAKNSNVAVLNAVKLSGKTGDDVNEHVWYDFPTVETVATKLASTYAKSDPKNAKAYRANAAAFNGKIAALEKREVELKTKYAGQGVSITEPVPLYMTDAIGLVDKTPEKFSEAIENGSDVAPAILQQTLSLYSDHSVKLLAYNEQTTGAQTQAVLDAAKKNDVPVVGVTETLPNGKTYLNWMSGNLDAIQSALAK